MEAKNPREGCAALVLGHYHQRRAGVARIRQTWLPIARIRQPDQASRRRVWHAVKVGLASLESTVGVFTPAGICLPSGSAAAGFGEGLGRTGRCHRAGRPPGTETTH
jgi:hypothetical protein